MASKLSSQEVTDTSITESTTSPVISKESVSFVQISVGPLDPTEREPEVPQVLEDSIEDTIVNIDSDDAFLKDPLPPTSGSSKAFKRKAILSITTEEGVQGIYSKRPSPMVAAVVDVQVAPQVQNTEVSGVPDSATEQEANLDDYDVSGT